jgi:uncharacterized protein (TIGR00730 family)
MGAELVYGGARYGLMEAAAKAAKESGAHVVGVVPTILEERDRVSSLLDEKIMCRNLSERKDIMLQRCDIMVALPGGIGTLDEIFHVLASATIGYHNKRLVLSNEGGFWNDFLAMLDSMEKKGFIRGNMCLSVVDDVAVLKNLIMEV